MPTSDRRHRALVALLEVGAGEKRARLPGALRGARQLDDRAVFLQRWWKLLRAQALASKDPAWAAFEAATRDWEWRKWQDAVTDWELKRYFEII